jgi:LacI family transcriptional regulator
MATIKDIARECGVSAMTVSAVINNKTGEVSALTRERVIDAMRRLKYRPSAVARGLVGKHMKAIGIADRLADPTYWSSPYESPVLEGIVSAARRHRWEIIYFTGHPSAQFTQSLPAYLDGRCDGMVFISHAMSEEEATLIVETGLPVVLIGDNQYKLKVSTIDVDNVAASYEAVQHLISLGHRRIAMFEGWGSSSNLPRIQGYRNALEDAGIEIDESLIRPSRAWEESGAEHAREVLSLPVADRPTAIFCFDDVVAFGAMKVARELGIDIPGDLSVVGFDDVHQAALSTPPLTTVRQPLRALGERAVDNLIRLIEGDLPVGHRDIVEHNLIIRESTAVPPC